jgi:hypothetical protein
MLSLANSCKAEAGIITIMMVKFKIKFGWMIKTILLFPLLSSYLPKKAGEYALYDLKKTFIGGAPLLCWAAPNC